jgi:hypothetical protein
LQKRRDFPIKFQPDGEMELLRAGCRWPPMPQHAIHPPIHLVIHPDEPIRSLEAAAKVIRRHAGDRPDGKAQELLHWIKGASTLEEADTAGKAFRAWAEAEGLLLVPPEDDGRA